MGIFLDGLQQSKYKNVPFFVRTETIANIGQKRIIHDYPNSSTRYAEAQGRSVFEETMDIFFHGDNYIADYTDFIKVIQDRAPGRLFMPVFGIINNVVALPARASSNQNNLGEIAMTVTFTQTIEKPAPTEILNTEEDVAEQAQVVRNELSESFEDNYEPPDTRNNILTAGSDFSNLAATITVLTQRAIQAQRFLRGVNRYISDASQLANLLLNPGQPQGYLQSIALSLVSTDALNIFRNIATVGDNLSNSMNDINDGTLPVESSVVPDVPGVEIDTNISLWDSDTVEREQRNNNRLASVNTFRITGLISMYEQAAERQYTTVEDIDDIRNVLDDYYIALIENDNTGVIIQDIKQSLDTLKNKTEAVLDQKRQNAFNIIEIVFKNIIPATLLAYDLYGEYIKTIAEWTFITGILKNLNSNLPAHRLAGILKVIEIG